MPQLRRDCRAASRTARVGASACIPDGWTRWLPGLQILAQLQLAWLPHDLVAGLVLTTMLVPVGIAYAVASGVPAIYGLYATIVPLLAYALFGPSRILVLGPDSVAGRGHSRGRAAAVRRRSRCAPSPWPARWRSCRGWCASWPAWCASGFVTELLSKPIRYGYMNGIALTVLISQLPKLFGFSIESDGPLRDLWAIGAGDPGRQGQLDGVRRRRRHAGGDPAAQALQAHSRHPDRGRRRDGRGRRASTWARRAGVKVLGPLPQGLPTFALPWISLADLGPVLIGGCAVAMVSFADTSVLSRTYAARTRTQVDPNQEMVGLGAANLAAGFFQGFPISSSSSRTPVAEAAGAQNAADRRGRRRGRRPAACRWRPICCRTCPSARWRPS